MGERKGTKGLELWCRKMTEGYPGVKIENMTTSWRDGLAFCAIIHHFRPDLIDFDKLDKDDIYHNNELAFRVAEHHLGIPALLEAEDMVEYEVPDRLSILTYLSQFYKSFEVQRGKSEARKAPKRPQSSPDHGIVSPASTSPPTKVQITVGKARREPCAKCGLPVFIAERLNVGKLLYHRTCFRCARCNSQLTLANYYETENGEFCCEICPDEEKIISKKPEHTVLLRSMSDEEKSASLQTYSEAPDAYSTHFEHALEFSVDRELKRDFTLKNIENAGFHKARSHFFKSQIKDSSESESENVPPDLPQSKPPLIETGVNDKKTSSVISVSDKGSFPREKIDNLVSDSVSEQTNDHFVTKDNVSSSGGVSVRARMKLFENNEEKKSDVNRYTNKVPLDSTHKKATVVAIDDLEDFDNVSKKDIEIEDISLDNNNTTNIPDEVITRENTDKAQLLNEKIDISKDYVEVNRDIELPVDQVISTKSHNNVVNQKIDLQPKITRDNSNESIIIIDDSEEEKSHITIEDSPSIEILDTSANKNTKVSPAVHILSDDSFVTASDSSSPKMNDVSSRGYYTCYATFSPSEQEVEPSEKEEVRPMSPILGPVMDLPSNEAKLPPDEEVVVPIQLRESLSPSDDNQQSNVLDNKMLIENDDNEPDETQTEEETVEPKTVQYESAYEETLSKPYKDRIDEDKPKQIDLILEESNVPSQDKSLNVVELHKSQDSLQLPKQSYPTDLNPFGDEETEVTLSASTSLNPFGDFDDEEVILAKPIPAPRPKKKKIPSSEDKEIQESPESSVDHKEENHYDPFEDDEENSETDTYVDKIAPKPVPVPRPKKKIIPTWEEKELTGTPECLAKIYTERISLYRCQDDEEEDDNLNKPTPSPRQKKKITLPYKISLNPFESDEEEEDIVPIQKPAHYSSTPSTHLESKTKDSLSIASKGSHGGSNSSISSGSAVGSARKKKPAPRPPLPFRTDQSGPSSLTTSPSSSLAQSPNLSGTIRSRKTKRAPLPPSIISSPTSSRKEIINKSIEFSSDSKSSENNKAVEDDIQQEKNVKDEENRNRQSQHLGNVIQIPESVDNSSLSVHNKSTLGRWKRKKVQAPTRPIPQRRIVKSLPMSEIRRELDTIEIQQQGLEKQGVRLEQIIREKCEGSEETATVDEALPIEVEDLILQLFELVNEKNELFRRQAELMYLRRQQRLEEEYADVEYQIRCLIMQPEANKTDSDKEREEALINRLVEIVERRNEIIECLEMDRVREAEEDNSISSQLNLYSLKRDIDKDQSQDGEKKEKKKKHKKLNKLIHTLHKHKEKEKEKEHKVDIDKDVDETEINSSSEKKKKKKFLF